MTRPKRKASKHKMVSVETKQMTKSKKTVISGDDLLLAAIENCDYLAAIKALERKDVELSKTCMNAALLKAVREGKKQIVQMLLTKAIEDFRSNETGSLALVTAAEHGYLDIVKQLTKKGVPVDGKNPAGRTALMAAVVNSCSSALISYLLDECGADLNLQDNSGKTVLMLAVEKWDYDVVQKLFMDKNQNCDETIKDKDGHTALDLAKKNGSANLMNVFSHSRLVKMSPLSLVAGWNKYELVLQLIQMYPLCLENITAGHSPLTIAMFGLDKKQDKWDGKIHCSYELIELLIEAGVDVNASHECGLTPLMFAADAGSETIVKMLLSNGADIHYVSFEKVGNKVKRRSALTIAASKGFVKIVELLVEAGSDMYLKNHSGKNALELATKNGHKPCIQFLLKRCKLVTANDIKLMEKYRVIDVFLHVQDRWDQLFEDKLQLHQLLCVAVNAGSSQLVKALVDYGGDINCQSHTPCPLLLALKDIDMLCLLLDLGADINTRVKVSGNTVLMQAASENNVLLVNTLLKNKADMYMESSGHTALTLACLKNNTDAVMALLDGGMDINHVTQTKFTALWCAVTGKNFTVTEALVKRGANVNFSSANGVTVLMHAIKCCTSNFSELLIKHGANIHVQDSSGNTALFHALKHSITREEKVLLLLQHGADVNHCNLSTSTPLMFAAQFCHVNVLKIFLSSKPRVNEQDINGNTALHIAAMYSDKTPEKVKALIGHGADLDIVNCDYETPLMIALKNLDANIVKCLLCYGASFVFKSSYVSKMWKTDLDYLITRNCRLNTNDVYLISFLDCMEALLEAGCSLHSACALSVDKFLGVSINCQRTKIVRLLLQSGVGPNLLDLTCLPESFPTDFIVNAVTMCFSNVSPLCTAILTEQPVIIAMFFQALFFHRCDIKMLQNPLIRAKLQDIFRNWTHENYFVVQQLFPENWSLRMLSKLAVHKVVGYGRGRGDRVKALPLPNGLQDELLQKNIFILNEDCELNPLPRPGVNLGLDVRD